jgi:prepilin-type N-terminal cleavage/methylation domain-containing protein
MPTSTQKTSNLLNNHHGFTLIEIMVALLLAALVFVAIPSGDSADQHRKLQTAVDDIDRSLRFAANEAVLRNTVVRLRFELDKNPIEYVVEYGPAGNLPLPEMTVKANPSLEEAKQETEKTSALDKQFNKVAEFDEVRREIHPDVTILGVATEASNKIIKDKPASIYFYPTGEKDAALVFFSTIEEVAWLEASPFMADTTATFEPIKGSVAKIEDILQTKMDEVYKAWVK